MERRKPSHLNSPNWSDSSSEESEVSQQKYFNNLRQSLNKNKNLMNKTYTKVNRVEPSDESASSVGDKSVPFSAAYLTGIKRRVDIKTQAMVGAKVLPPLQTPTGNAARTQNPLDRRKLPSPVIAADSKNETAKEENDSRKLGENAKTPRRDLTLDFGEESQITHLPNQCTFPARKTSSSSEHHWKTSTPLNHKVPSKEKNVCLVPIPTIALSDSSEDLALKASKSNVPALQNLPEANSQSNSDTLIQQAVKSKEGLVRKATFSDHLKIGQLPGQRRISYAQNYTLRLHNKDNTGFNTWSVKSLDKLRSTESEDQSLGEALLPQNNMRNKRTVQNMRAEMSMWGIWYHDFQVSRKRKKYNHDSNFVLRSKIKKIEGLFGSGMVSFFVYVRWLFLLNLLLCSLWTSLVVLPQALFFDKYHLVLDNFYFRNLLDGTNGLQGTWMFYGGYSTNIGVYPLSLVYLLCALFTYFGSLFIVFKSIADALGSEGHLADNRYRYCNLVMTGWDYTLTDEKAASTLSSVLTNICKDLISDAKTKTKSHQSKSRSFRVISGRIGGWILTIILIGGGCTAIVFITLTDFIEVFNSMNHTLSEDHMLVVYGPVLCFMAINALVPLCVYKLTHLENYSGKVELQVATLRVFVLRMANILALVVSLYIKQSAHTGCVGTFIGQELYKLVILQIVVQAVVQLIPRFTMYYWSGQKTEFQMPSRVLMIVYRQALIWLGSLVCPIMPFIGMISTLIVFYVDYTVVKYTCKPPSKRWNQARRNTLFLGLTVATLLVLILPVSIVITRNDVLRLWIDTDSPAHGALSQQYGVCGPFGNQSLISAFWETKDQVLRSTPMATDILDMVMSSTIVMPMLFVIIGLVYFQRLQINWQKDSINRISTELQTERDQNKQLILRNHALGDGPTFYN